MNRFMSEGGRLFREAWIAGVRRNYPREPKAGYVAGWDQIPDWERMAAAMVHYQVYGLVTASTGATSKLTREQKGRFVAICWTAQVYRHLAEPKASYVADWNDLPEWQQQTDADIFEHIEDVVRDET